MRINRSNLPPPPRETVAADATHLAAATPAAAEPAAETTTTTSSSVRSGARRTGRHLAQTSGGLDATTANSRSSHGGASTTPTPRRGLSALDPRHVTTRRGNEILREHGLGAWERGTGTDRSRLQSAVIAGEHIKTFARDFGVEVSPDMSQRDLATLIAGYTTGTRAARRAGERGTTWMLDPSDQHPHPLHPGGTSVGRGGRRIRVQPSRKEGLLRWDTLLPLVEEQLRSARR